jgi:hypothetical protein
MTHVYLAFPGYGAIHRAFHGYRWNDHPINFLVAYPYVSAYADEARRYQYAPRRTFLDSGAFTAWKTGASIDIGALCRESERWTESASLDVIGDWQGSKANAVKMRLLGSRAMPVFHIEEPWELLEFYCKHWPKVGLGGMVGRSSIDVCKWLNGVYARAWPHRFHAFGQMRRDVVTRFPFHSADSSAWQQGPLSYSASIRVRRALVGSPRGLSARQIVPCLLYSVEHMIELESTLKQQWATELEPLGDWP